MTCQYSLLKRHLGISFAGTVLVLLAFAFVSQANGARQLPRVWMDQSSGYAIGGYDPVDYFVRSEPVRLDNGIEAVWGGVSWSFRNTGNRQAFLSDPQIYAPRFGGADPYLLARHKQVAGNPTLFDIYKGRLYLFYSGNTLSRWRQNRAAFIVHAKQAWPKAALKLGLDAGIRRPAPDIIKGTVPDTGSGLFPRK